MRLLLVSPHFPPTNAADMHRVRCALPFLESHGFEAEVIAIDPAQVEAPVDPLLTRTYPADIPLHRVQAMSLKWRGVPGFGTLGWRCARAIERQLHTRLSELMTQGETAVVYFSTTQFAVQGMIPGLVRHFGCAVFIDYQDPWVNDYYRLHPEVTPPGGRLKHALAYQLAKRAEKRVLPWLAGYTAVSQRYVMDLEERYGEKAAEIPSLVLPFSGNAADMEQAATEAVSQSQFNPQDGRVHWVYVGRGGEDMATALSGLFRALRRAEAEGRVPPRLRLHFLGTDYAAGERARHTVSPLAEAHGVAHLVEERPQRIPYFEALRCLLEADALLIPGSDDPGYTASKIYPYILARKPLLALFHEKSPVNALMQETGAGVLCQHRGKGGDPSLAEGIYAKWFQPKAWEKTPATNWPAFHPHTAEQMTARLAGFFHSVLKSRKESIG